MPRQTIDIRRTVAASPAAVFALLGDSSTWPEWTPIDDVELERPGGPDGVGEIRAFRTGHYRIREEIVERVPERRLTYILLGGLAVRDYRAVIDLEPVEDGTAIRWHTTFRGAVPGTGWMYRLGLTKATERFVEGLAERAARRAVEPAAA